MSDRSADDAAGAVRYLLGKMSDEESRALEQRVLVSREVFDDVMAAEDDLIDEYLEGGLSPAERQDFERVYLSAPDRRARVDFARALREKIGQSIVRRPVAVLSPPVRRPSFPGWLAAAAVLFAAVGLYFAVDGARLRREVSRLRQVTESASRRESDAARQVTELRDRSVRLERDLQSQKDEAGRLADQMAALRQQGSKVVSFLLIGGLVRDGGELQTLRIPSDAALMRLGVPLTPGSSYASYRAVVQSPEGKSFWSGTGAWPAAGAKTVTVAVPAASLPAGDYILSLTGVLADGQREPAADFSFRVTRI